MRLGRGATSECLPDTEKEIEMSCLPRKELSRGRDPVHFVGNRLKTGIRRWIQIVPEIEADRTDGSLVVHPQAERVRNVTEVALGIGLFMHAGAGTFLAPAEEVVHHIAGLGEHIAHVMENYEV